MTTSSDRSYRKAAVVGAGQTGVTAALGLLDAGFAVTLYSDRDQQSLRNDVPPTGTALEFGETQQAESALGLDNYTARAPRQTGLSVRIAGPEGAELIAFDGNFDGYVGVAVDTRLKADERLTAFLERGGQFRVEAVTPESLDGIAAENDLTLVATGKGGLAGLFPTDEARTPYSEPQRKVLTVYVTGLDFDEHVFAHRSPAGGSHSLFSITEHGEAYWGPYLHKDAGPSWAYLGWARPGGAWDERFSQPTDAASTLETVKQLYRDYIDWDVPEIEATKVIEEDPHSWLKGAVRPITRAGVAETANGHLVASLGDTSIAHDPIAGQGAQGGLIQAQRLVAAAAVHDGPFDRAWLQAQYDAYLAARGDASNKVTRLYLSDPEFAYAASQFFPAAAVDPQFASALVGLLHRPQAFLPINDEADAAAYIKQVTGIEAADVLAQFTPAGRFERSSFAPVLAR